VTDEVLALVADCCREGLTVSQIERKLKISNRNVRSAKAQLYKTDTLPTPGYGPRKTYGDHSQN
jgi:hypothetical protein